MYLLRRGLPQDDAVHISHDVAPPDFLANIIIWGCGPAKVGVVVQKFHVHSLHAPHF